MRYLAIIFVLFPFFSVGQDNSNEFKNTITQTGVNNNGDKSEQKQSKNKSKKIKALNLEYKISNIVNPLNLNINFSSKPNYYRETNSDTSITKGLYDVQPYKMVFNMKDPKKEKTSIGAIDNFGIVHSGDTCILSFLKKNDFKGKNQEFYFTLLDFRPDNTVSLLYPSNDYPYSDCLLKDDRKIESHLGFAPPFGQEKLLAIYSENPLLDIYEKSKSGNQDYLYKLGLDILSGHPSYALKDCYFDIISFEIKEPKNLNLKDTLMGNNGSLFIPNYCPDEDLYINCPNLTLLNPKQLNYTRGGETILINTKKYVLSGIADCKMGVKNVLVNKEEATLSKFSESTTYWEKEISLVEGKNNIEIEAFSTGGNENKRHVDLDFNIDTTTLSKNSNNYLVVIGINKYKYWPQLNTAVGDAEEVKKTLLSRYNFLPDYTYSLLDTNATIENIDNLMENLLLKVGDNDNILIYYAGHGYNDTLLHQGYWIPVNAQKKTKSDYFSNSDLYQYIKYFKAKHTLIIADACFSGSLYLNSSGRGDEDKFQENLYQERSKWVFSSGGMEKVDDELYGTGHSPFANCLLNILNKSENDILISDLVNKVGTIVAHNSKQTPHGAPIKDAGDEGGQFLFQLKK